jgi:BirA family biotin operon repressor/biotin-[acetyl-CoA-carboxylase] ligase
LYHNSELSLGHHQLHLSEVTSTNDLAKQLAEEQLGGHGTLITADFQQKGRGQELTAWESEKGLNLMCSLILVPEKLQADEQVYLNIVICLAVHDMVSEYLPGADVAIKWPNDVYVNGKKVAGILIESSLQGALVKQVIAGMGININQAAFVNPGAVSFVQVNKAQCDLKECTGTLVRHLNTRYAQLAGNQREQLWTEYHEVLYKKDVPATFETGEGVFSGTVKGIDKAGRLMVYTGSSMRTFHVKQIRWL